MDTHMAGKSKEVRQWTKKTKKRPEEGESGGETEFKQK